MQMKDANVPSQLESAVQRYIRELSPASRARLLKTYAAETEEFAHLIFRLVESLQFYHVKNKTHDASDPKQAAFALMTKGANGLMAGFELAIGGYAWEPPVVFRSALEGFAVGWDIAQNPDRFALWKARKAFQSSDSITNLKKEIEPIGKLYGYLSNMHVHTAPINSSPQMWKFDEELTFQFFGFVPEGKEEARRGDVLFALLVAHICLQLTELVFYNYAAALETIEQVPGTDTVRTVVSPRHQPFVQAAMSYFNEIAEMERH